MDWLKNMFRYRIVQYLGIVVGVLFIGLIVILFDVYDKKANYVQTTGKILEVKSECYMKKKEGKKTMTSDMLPCDVASRLVATHPNWSGFEVKYKSDVKLSFRSPMDDKDHVGQLELTDGDVIKGLELGGPMKVLASKSDPEKLRVP